MSLLSVFKLKCSCPQEVDQSVGTTPNEAEVTNSNLPSCANMSKKKTKKKEVKVLLFRWFQLMLLCQTYMEWKLGQVEEEAEGNNNNINWYLTNLCAIG
jgi:putative AlgH/UPF0301 family transcriptional regulator